MKKHIKSAAAFALLVGFIVLAIYVDMPIGF